MSILTQKTNIIYRIRKALENRTNMEDDRVAILENQLSQAKLIAEEADKKYEEVHMFILVQHLTLAYYIKKIIEECLYK